MLRALVTTTLANLVKLQLSLPPQMQHQQWWLLQQRLLTFLQENNLHVRCCQLLWFIVLVTMQVANWVQIRLVPLAKLLAQCQALRALLLM